MNGIRHRGTALLDGRFHPLRTRGNGRAIDQQIQGVNISGHIRGIN
ncbi:Uncharacterised protein [Yersinia similis]|nr:Uncharacterised protein [Yersinia similis]CNG60793.1 Uncharacterised protein [Yersinia similis]